MQSKTPALVRILALAAAVAVVGLALAPGAPALVKPGARLPGLTLPTLEGGELSLAGLTKGKVALLVYWSVSCPHCRADLPQLLLLAKRFEGNPFVMLTVNADGPAMAPAASGYAAEQKLPKPWLHDVGPEDGQPFGEAMDIIATPGVLVVNPRGEVVLAQELKVDLEAVDKAIQEAFAQQ